MYIFLVLSFIIGCLDALACTAPRDFGSFYDSGVAFTRGENPYSSDGENIFRPELNEVKYPSPNMNPPISLYLVSLFTLFPLSASYQIWRTISLVFYIISILLVFKYFKIDNPNLKFLWAFTLGGLWHTIQLGQLYPILLFSMVLGLISIKLKRYLLVGLFFGFVISFKPNFGLIILVLLACRHFKLGLWVALFSAIFTLLPLISGVQNYIWWIQTASTYKGISLPSNDSIIGLSTVYKLIPYGYGISFIGVIYFLWFLYKRPVTLPFALYLGVLSALLFSPITWAGYVILLVPFLIARVWRKSDYPVIIVLSFPAIILYSILAAFPQTLQYLSWLYGYAYLFLFISEIVLLQKKEVIQEILVFKNAETTCRSELPMQQAR